MGRPADVEVAGIVVHPDGDPLAALEAEPAQQVRGAVGPRVQFPERDRSPAAGHDDGRTVGIAQELFARVHRVVLQKLTRSPPLRSIISRASAGVATSSESSSRMCLILATCWAFDFAFTPLDR